eukprot:4714503-Amphidinium_carterae.2
MERDIEDNKTNENKEYENKKYNDENNEEDEYDKEQEEMQTMIIYKMENNALGRMQKMNIKLPSPTQFGGRCPKFYKWAGEVKAYLNVHNVNCLNIEDIMDDCTKSVTVILLGDIQDKDAADEVRKYNTSFPAALQGGARRGVR